MITLAFVLQGLAAAGFLFRLLAGPTLGDRVVALDGLVLVVVGILAVDAVRTGSGTFVDAIVVIALLGFVATGVAARFIERQGS
jgi:multicomponent Na+:H+ antiporter subunit F